MKITGTLRLDRRTKNLTKRIQPGDIALIAHDDIDAVAAESLVERKPRAVLNCRKSLTGKYINRGPYAILRAGIALVDGIGDDIMGAVTEGDAIELRDGEIFKNGDTLGRGTVQTLALLDADIEAARTNMEDQINSFAENTLGYLKKEVYLLTRELSTVGLDVNFKGRHVLVVVRGPEFKQDLQILRQYIRGKRPVLIAVDGGADALVKLGFKPDIILGDMDSVTDETLRCGARIIVHGYADGRAPGMKRIESLGLSGHVIGITGTSEDLALLLAYERGAELIVIVGSHFSIEDFLAKDRAGMSSTFLTRLKVGSILVDAKGVSKLYGTPFKPALLLVIILAAMFPILVLLYVSPIGELFKEFFRIFKLLY